MWQSRCWSVVCCIGLLSAGAAHAQEFPNKPIRIVTSAAGGGNDIIGRIVAQGISGPLGVAAIVDNRTGMVSIESTVKAPPDGYTLLFQSNITWLSPFMQQVNFDPVRDLSPITLAATAPSLLIVHPALPVKSVKDLIALARARPGDLNYATAGAGGALHLAAELFKAMAHVNILAVMYRGSGPAMNSLFSGEVQVMFQTASAAVPHLKSGRFRALAVTSLQPSVVVPGLPTIAASGVPGYESVTLYSFFAPAKTPAEVINRLNREIVRFIQTPATKERLLTVAVESVGSTSEQLAATIKSDMATTGKVIKDAGIRAE